MKTTNSHDSTVAASTISAKSQQNFIVPIKEEFLYKNGYQPRYEHDILNLVKSSETSACVKKVEKIDKESTPREDDQNDKDNDEKVENSDEPAKKRQKIRGQNKKRPREKRLDAKFQLCSSILNEKLCRFGESCKFSHDIRTYWLNKPADLGERCPIFDKFGYCKYGVACRFAKSHLDSELNNLKRFKEDENSLESTNFDRSTKKSLKSDGNQEDIGKINKNSEKLATNALDFEFRRKLQKRTYDFALSAEYLFKLSPKNNVEGKNTANTETLDKNNDEISCKNDGSVVTVEKRVPKKFSADDFRGKLFLAPLTTVGNLPFRRVCVGFGAEITCGEMAMATELLQGSQSEWALMRRHESEKFFGVQLCGSHADTMTKCAQMLTENCQLDFIDLNMGCPIDLICRKGAGCMLMHKTKRLAEIIGGMQYVIGDVPLTLKMRTGVYDGKNTAHSLMPIVKDWNISAVTIHGRSREQRYTKSADWTYVNTCARSANPVPLFGCGDILSYEDYYQRLSEYPDVSGCMLARGALIKPWLFTEIKERRHWDISSSERLDILKTYVNYGLEHWGSDQRGVDTTRRFLLEWLSFLYRYVPVGLLERVPQKINERPPSYFGRDQLETWMASPNCADWIKISELLLGPVADDFQFLPKHKANSYQT